MPPSDALPVLDPAVLDAQTSLILSGLDECERAEGPDALKAALFKLKPVVLAHLALKDQLYAEIGRVCERTRDSRGAEVAEQFKLNMVLLTAATRRFFEETLTETATPETLLRGFATVSAVLRNRLDTESRAVLPLYTRNLSMLARGRKLPGLDGSSP